MSPTAITSCLVCDAPIRSLEWPQLCQRCAMACVLELSQRELDAQDGQTTRNIRAWALARRAKVLAHRLGK